MESCIRSYIHFCIFEMISDYFTNDPSYIIPYDNVSDYVPNSHFDTVQPINSQSGGDHSEPNSVTTSDSQSKQSGRYFSVRHLTKSQLGVIFDVLKHAVQYVNIYTMSDGNGNAFETVSSDYIFGLNATNNQLTYLYTKYYNTDSKSLYSPNYIINLRTNSNRNILSTNIYRCQIHAKFFDNVSVSNDVASMFNDVLTLIHNSKFDVVINQLPDVNSINSQTEYSEFMAYITRRHDCQQYLCNKCLNQSYVNYSIIDKYKLVTVPKEIQRKFNKIGKYFDEVKGQLILNESNGFYCYPVDGVNVPILCKHEYMIISGVAPTEMAIECYKKGKCKYCGQELNAYHEQVNDALPPRVYDLIYKYISTINENLDGENLMYVLFNLLYDVIQKNLKTGVTKNYDASVVALTGLFLYKIYMITKDKFKYNNKLNKFLDLVREYGSAVGWSQERMNDVINSNELFDNLNNITDIIREKMYTNVINFADLLPLSIMFNQLIELNNNMNEQLNVKTKIQKLYTDGLDKMIQLNKLIDQAYNSIWKRPTVIDSGKEVHRTCRTTNIEIVHTTNGERFFGLTCKIYCPVNMVHDFGKSSTCEYCGMKKDESNVKSIYKKYSNVINTNYLQQPNVLAEAKFNIDNLCKLDDVNKYSGNDLFDKYLIIDNHLIRQLIENNLNNKVQINEVKRLLSVLTMFNPNDISDDILFIKKVLSMIIDLNIKSSNELLNELKYIFMKIDNIQLLLI